MFLKEKIGRTNWKKLGTVHFKVTSLDWSKNSSHLQRLIFHLSPDSHPSYVKCFWKAATISSPEKNLPTGRADSRDICRSQKLCVTKSQCVLFLVVLSGFYLKVTVFFNSKKNWSCWRGKKGGDVVFLQVDRLFKNIPFERNWIFGPFLEGCNSAPASTEDRAPNQRYWRIVSQIPRLWKVLHTQKNPINLFFGGGSKCPVVFMF